MRLSLCIVTNDVQRLVHFYRLLLGLDEAGDNTYVEFAVGEEWGLAIADATTLELVAPGAHRPATNRSVRIELEVDDPDASFARITGANAEVVTPPTDWPWGTRACWVRDPDGNLVSLFRLTGDAHGRSPAG